MSGSDGEPHRKMGKLQLVDLGVDRRSESKQVNTPFALNAWVLYLASVPRRRAENSAFHLPAHHVTSPDTSRGETQHARLTRVKIRAESKCAFTFFMRQIAQKADFQNLTADRGQSAS